ncbi:AzlC family ABC transporter permease [Corynebacterium aquilae]|uniref:AzlC family ABC transporter permease n=1 Tax=Corynebacterium aquilae TaxID=203263 RepID=UPI0012ED8C5C|nr:AzlC family ABC transporter permease [Corynebacterium aquilae]
MNQPTTPTPPKPSECRQAAQLCAPMLLGLVPLGLAFGIVVTQSGFAWFWAPILSLVIYSGSMEFLALGLISSGAGLVTAAVTALVVNFRHIFYGLTHPRTTGLAGAYTVYSLTDEAYALLAGKTKTSPRLLVWLHLFCQLAWVIPGIIGAIIGARIPGQLPGIDFILPALFAALATEAYRSARAPRLVAVAVGCIALTTIAAPSAALMIALVMYATIAMAPGLATTKPATTKIRRMTKAKQ